METVYNIEVEDFHTYHVGAAGIWVHNTCGRGSKRTATQAGLDSGNYQVWDDYAQPARLLRGTGVTPDHIPSVGAAFRRLEATGLPPGLQRQAGPGRSIAFDSLATLVVPTRDHQQYSRTYGGRNTAVRMDWDARNFGAAIWADVFAYSRALGRDEMSAAPNWVRQTRWAEQLTQRQIASGMMGPEENPFPSRITERRWSF